jgi:hypothetical protein
MTTRRPPALANWLLDRLGPARLNPPLAGDLLEEFRSGRSAAWFWRQTLVAIVTGFAKRARGSRRLLTGSVIGRTAQVGVTFTLWLLQFPPRLPYAWRGEAGVAVFFLWSVVVWPTIWHQLRRRSSAPDGQWMTACDPFFRFLAIYCLITLFMGAPSFVGFVGMQAVFFLLGYGRSLSFRQLSIVSAAKSA